MNWSWLSKSARWVGKNWQTILAVVGAVKAQKDKK